MALPVFVKSTKRGIQLVLDNKIPFNELIDKIYEKFHASKEFYKDTRFSLSFSGRVLSCEEQKEIIQIISDTTGADIICILEENELLDEYIAQRMEQIAIEKRLKSGLFHKGSILSGQILECESSVIILGDICSGGKVLSKGNIIVIGSLKGYAYAGVSGRCDSFISALSIESTHLRIANCVIKNAMTSFASIRNSANNALQMARAKDKTIVIEPIKGYLDVI